MANGTLCWSLDGGHAPRDLPTAQGMTLDQQTSPEGVLVGAQDEDAIALGLKSQRGGRWHVLLVFCADLVCSYSV